MAPNNKETSGLYRLAARRISDLIPIAVPLTTAGVVLTVAVFVSGRPLTSSVGIIGVVAACIAPTLFILAGAIRNEHENVALQWGLDLPRIAPLLPSSRDFFIPVDPTENLQHVVDVIKGHGRTGNFDIAVRDGDGWWLLHVAVAVPIPSAEEQERMGSPRWAEQIGSSPKEHVDSENAGRRMTLVERIAKGLAVDPGQMRRR